MLERKTPPEGKLAFDTSILGGKVKSVTLTVEKSEPGHKVITRALRDTGVNVELALLCIQVGNRHVVT